MSVVAEHAVVARLAVRAPGVVERLRVLLVNQAGEAVLSCRFQPGGQFNGVGIRSRLYCANCSQGLMWHEVAAGLALIATAEGIIAAQAEEDVRHG